MLGLQTKLVISEPGDWYEQEADRVADAVVAGRPVGAIVLSLRLFHRQ